ncbi:hypothetical protein AFK69_00300 [Xenorhabdus sp. GDc328]|nr:hypothetical protein AAY47_18315 [Xenorhabdus griffiniae]KOP35211.1 hypothetical protein AFK69_00300 [Xenorhabdus sp. GDc328]
MQQKNCFFCSFAHKTIVFNASGVFFNSFRLNIQQTTLVQEEPINASANYFFKLFVSHLSLS